MPVIDRDSLPPLRTWQRKAMVAYHRNAAEDFLAVATPGAGKTTFALRIALDLLDSGIVSQVTVVAPTEHLKTQWSQAAARVGINLDPTFRNADVFLSNDFHGAVVTYAQVGADPSVHKRRTLARPTLVILDEIHHAGDARSWGEGVQAAFTPAVRRLALTGTPFRSDDNPIPFVSYEHGADGSLRSRPDSVYGYTHALTDGVVRPVMFIAYSGQARWRSSAGEELSVRLGEPLTKDLTAQAWRTALDPLGEWIPQVLRAADSRLNALRAAGMPDAGGLVIASDQNSARAYSKILGTITGERPALVLSDDAGSSDRIAKFTESDERWMIAVRMVSEGVDIPRLAVGVYATNAHTPLFFAQAIGRFVRSRRRGETASVFVPSVAPILELAAQLEADRDHVIAPETDTDPEDLLAEAQRQRDEPDGLRGERETLAATAELDQVIFDGASFGTPIQPGSPEEEEFLGLPGLLTPEQVSMLLQKRQADQLSTARPGAQASVKTETRPLSAAERRIALRKQLNALVSAQHHATNVPHGKIHAELRRRCGGPPSAQATIEQLEQRIEAIKDL
ncbi:DEAD/DEAH box helicase [Stackebrandtia nassauensis]|uniref:Type III restriction protein res subunit n=1 Tax=Stackebrandtia nassauensis (strain DSM 44728 / CIP 108903 / NRRL B-16338 / NBRC 102104 / LLR-40K-21) TaxID=446470 RepID=D3Q5D4_STANL|nr:DEAD/DEAH box helicase [Stackebrandtia nassauensis]ADD44183.1 type III restriction protein res subunit [Stackebrandtia nassauensis DSM 44728]